jgi:hypothetical protein
VDKTMNILRAYASAAAALDGLDRDAYLSVAAALVEAAPGKGAAAPVVAPRAASPYVVRVRRKRLADRMRAELKKGPQTAHELAGRLGVPRTSVWRALRALGAHRESGRGGRGNPVVWALAK